MSLSRREWSDGEASSQFQPAPVPASAPVHWGSQSQLRQVTCWQGSDQDRFNAYIGDRDRPNGLLVSANSDRPGPPVIFQVEAVDLHGHAEQGRSGHGCHLAMEHEENPETGSHPSWASTTSPSMELGK